MITVETFRSEEMGNNAYLVYGAGEEAALIDAAGTFLLRDENGTPIKTVGKYREIAARAERIGKRVAAVLLTHGHWDHVADAAEWQRRGAKIFLAEKDAKTADGAGNLASFFGRRIEPFTPDRLLNDGDVVSVGDMAFEVIAAPGHSEGSVVYKIEDKLFTGDTLFHGYFGRFDLPGGDFRKLYGSILRLFALEGDFRVYPGHEEATTLSAERAGNAILRYAEESF